MYKQENNTILHPNADLICCGAVGRWVHVMFKNNLISQVSKREEKYLNFILLINIHWLNIKQQITLILIPLYLYIIFLSLPISLSVISLWTSAAATFSRRFLVLVDLLNISKRSKSSKRNKH